MSHAIPIQHAQIDLSGMVLPNGLLVERISVAGRDVQIQPKPLDLILSAPGTLSAELTEGELARFISGQLPAAVRDVEVQCIGGRLQVAAIAKVVFEIRAIAMCRLEIVHGRFIYVRLESVEPGGPVGSLIESQIDRINPVFDAADLPLPVTLQSVSSEAGRLTVSGIFEWGG